MGRQKAGLAVTITIAVVVLVCVSTGLLLFDARTTGADALRTGGFAAGSVVALYALWLNDRRRRTEEQRQALEHRRTEHDRGRVADERFARAVELLGNEADQVRVGAMHALAGLARTDPAYTQTVLDVLCSYLRRPFDHPRYAQEVSAAPEWTKQESNEAERELQVRLAAQRLIVELLPKTGDSGAPHYDLDLTNAVLEYFDPSGRQVGTLVARYARVLSDANFSRCEIHGPAWFTGASTGAGRLSGFFRCEDAVFHDRAWFRGMTFHASASFDRTRFLGPVNFSRSRFHSDMSTVDVAFEGPTTFDDSAFDTAAAR
jgi:hypothetical protein